MLFRIRWTLSRAVIVMMIVLASPSHAEDQRSGVEGSKVEAKPPDAVPGTQWSCYEIGNDKASKTSVCQRTAKQCEARRREEPGKTSKCKTQKRAFMTYFDDEAGGHLWRAFTTKAHCERFVSSIGKLAKAGCHSIGAVERQPIRPGFLRNTPIYCAPTEGSELSTMCRFGDWCATSHGDSCRRVEVAYGGVWNNMLFMTPARKECEAFVEMYSIDAYPPPMTGCVELRSPQP